ncbi:MAG: 1-deoxy-D-xylulose-5-phosphate reductoisomerase [Deltaproteobacteria bacterium]|nr:1-deoxy-D-xylulose-5-phosphate reductoisomerase [Deltaproteobacteria bacterium]MBW2153175.1 1-deoxy-D-xylulose-5-phosphate reductoisomerase [Deltaproteobacteria bacterium]
MKKLTILGSTGSIGSNTLSVVERFPDRFTVKALTAKRNIKLLAEQIKKFSPDIAVVFDEASANELKENLPKKLQVEVLHGEQGYRQAATLGDVDLVVSAMVGAAGLIPTLAAIEAGKTIALANKETLVMAGELVMQAASERGVDILPVDSEHSAIFQCLLGHRKEEMDRIFLTASGGPFRTIPRSGFDAIKPQDALKHPTWQMGKKITIDSATLINKGFEVIEAKFLFGISHDQISVVIHPQSIVHSMVAYRDGSIIAQMGIPDMKTAIAYAISYPERLPLKQPLPDFEKIGSLTFEKPDVEKFPCLSLAYRAVTVGGTLPAVLNAANEIAVKAFLDKRISFVQIPQIIQNTMEAHRVIENPSLSEVLEADQWARGYVKENILKPTIREGRADDSSNDGSK